MRRETGDGRRETGEGGRRKGGGWKGAGAACIASSRASSVSPPNSFAAISTSRSHAKATGAYGGGGVGGGSGGGGGGSGGEGGGGEGGGAYLALKVPVCPKHGSKGRAVSQSEGPSMRITTVCRSQFQVSEL